MNKQAIIIAFIVFAAYANAQCASNAQGNAGSCMCNQGYYGTDAENGGSCNQCPDGTSTDAPSLSVGGNTNASAEISVCNQCQANFYMTDAAAAASINNAALMFQLPYWNWKQRTNYYQTAAAVAASTGVTAAAVTCQSCPSGSTSAAGAAQQASDCQSNYTTNSNILFASLSILMLAVFA
ncbi:hypothetical protein ABPG72_008157 [Tetrahymena utriculariae]